MLKAATKRARSRIDGGVRKPDTKNRSGKFAAALNIGMHIYIHVCVWECIPRTNMKMIGRML